MDNELRKDLKDCLDCFAKPLLQLFQRTAGLIDQAVAQGAGNPLKLYIESQRLCCRIFFSFNFQDLPEFFEDHCSEWMNEFLKYLTIKYSALEGDGKDGLALVDSLRCAVCKNIRVYMERDEDVFQVHLGGFVDAVWNLLVSTSVSSSREKLTVTAIKFLTTVSKGVHYSLFASDNVLQQICQNIVIPNVMLRDEDEELFEMDYVEFIRKDMEGSDADTRRRIACQLLEGISLHYKEKIAQMVSSQIHSSLDAFSKNPDENWKHKDCAIYLVVSLASIFSAGLVDVESFFVSVIVPELQCSDVNAFPMLKAGALKFFTVFRNQISKPTALALLPLVVRFLDSTSNVVHSYAANCIEKLLLVKDDKIRPRYTGADIGPQLLLELMKNLFSALQKQDSEENSYIMKSIMRVLSMADVTQDIAVPCINGLTAILNKVCANPKSPMFNHYLFESVAFLVRRASERDRRMIAVFENSLFPSLQIILSGDINSEFFPYAFQLLAQLVELTPSLDSYVQIFEILLLPCSWENSANVPALVDLLQAFLRRLPHEMMAQQGRLANMIDIISKLVSSPSSDKQGFFVLNAMIENISYDVMEPFVGKIWDALFSRLKQKRTLKFDKSLVVSISLFLIRYGTDRLVGSIHADSFRTVLELWIPTLKQITGFTELKLTSVASTKLACEFPNALGSHQHWVKMLDSILTLVSRPEEQRVMDDEQEVLEFAENAGYKARFSRLHGIGKKKEEDPLKEIKDPKQFLEVLLSNTFAASPGVYASVISNNLDQADADNRAALLQLCNYH